MYCEICQVENQNPKQHKESVLHRQHRRIQTYLAKDCLTYSEIGKRTGVTRERIRQIAIQLNIEKNGRERRTSCVLTKEYLRSGKIPFVKAARAKGLDVIAASRWAVRTFEVNGNVVRLFKSFSRPYNPALVILSAPHTPADFIAWDIRDGDYLIVPAIR